MAFNIQGSALLEICLSTHRLMLTCIIFNIGDLFTKTASLNSFPLSITSQYHTHSKSIAILFPIDAKTAISKKNSSGFMGHTFSTQAILACKIKWTGSLFPFFSANRHCHIRVRVI